MKTLTQQGVSVITQTRAILSAKYGYSILSGYTDFETELKNDEGTMIYLKEKNFEITFRVDVLETNKRFAKTKKETIKLITDLLHIVIILN